MPITRQILFRFFARVGSLFLRFIFGLARLFSRLFSGLFLRALLARFRQLLLLLVEQRFRIRFALYHLFFLLPFYPLDKRNAAPLRLPSSSVAGDKRKGELLLSGICDWGGQRISRPQPFWSPISAGAPWLSYCHSFSWLSDLRAYASVNPLSESQLLAVRFAHERLSDWLLRHEHWSWEFWQPALVRCRLLTLLCHYDWYSSAFSEQSIPGSHSSSSHSSGSHSSGSHRSSLHRALYAHYRHLRRLSRLGNSRLGNSRLGNSRLGNSRLGNSRLGDSFGASGFGVNFSFSASEERLLGQITCVICGLCFGDSPKRLRSDERSLCRELDYQISSGDGFWLGRKADSHLAIMLALLEAKSLYGLAQSLPPEGLLSALDRMTPALKMLRSSDGGLTTFQGSQETDSRLVSRVLSRVQVRGQTPLSSRSGGFERLSSGRGVVLIDSACGGIFRSGLHASPGAFEFSYGRDRIVVSCSLSGLPSSFSGSSFSGSAFSSNLSRFSRTTAAHSMLCLDDRNAFSLGLFGTRRARVSVERVLGESGQPSLSLRHDGYRDIFGLIIFRDFHLSSSGNILFGQDRIVAASPYTRHLFSSRLVNLRFALRFHIHPSVRVFPLRNSREAILKPDNRPGFRFQSLGPVNLSVADSLYGGSGSLLRTRQLVLSGDISRDILTEDFLLPWRFQHETDE